MVRMVSMTIAFKDGRYFLGMWFVCGSNTRDWLCAIYRESPTAKWEMRYRFRYYVDNKNGADSQDDKNWYHATMSPETTEGKLVEVGDAMANGLVEKGFGPCLHRDIMKSDRAKRCVEFFEKNPSWAHQGRVSGAAADKMIAGVKEFNDEWEKQKASS